MKVLGTVRIIPDRVRYLFAVCLLVARAVLLVTLATVTIIVVANKTSEILSTVLIYVAFQNNWAQRASYLH